MNGKAYYLQKNVNDWLLVKSCKEENQKWKNITQETIEYLTINDKANPQPLTETPLSTTSAAAPTTVQEKVKQKISTKNYIQVILFQKGDLEKLSQSDLKKITSRGITLKKYKADLKENEAARCTHIPCKSKFKIQAIE